MAAPAGGPGPSSSTAGLLEVRGKVFLPTSGPLLVVCCGPPGSGKSWFAEMLEVCKEYVRVTQDELSRSGSKDAFSDAVRRGLPVVVDICNATAEKRTAWLSLAGARARAYSAKVCVYFSADVETCKQRAEQRKKSHPTLKSERSINAALEQFTREFQEPQIAREGFTTLCVVPSTNSSNLLLQSYFGVTPDRLEAAKSSMNSPQCSSEFEHFKFPRTKHLLDVGGATRDDLVIEVSDRKKFFDPGPGTVVTVEEKVDGSNLGISLDADCVLRAQNRSHFVHSDSHIQYKAVDSWLQQHSADLYQILLRDGKGTPGRLILFGEWLAAKHSINYSRLPDRFLAFDIYDRKKGKFLSRSRFKQCLEGTRVFSVPTLTNIPLPLEEATIRRLMSTQSSFCDGAIEGVYVRIDHGDWLSERAKVVREDFIAGNEHWSRNIMTWNGLAFQEAKV